MHVLHASTYLYTCYSNMYIQGWLHSHIHPLKQVPIQLSIILCKLTDTYKILTYSNTIEYKYMYNIYLVGGLEHGFYFPIQLGMSSSQVTNSIIFQRRRFTTNQSTIINHH